MLWIYRRSIYIEDTANLVEQATFHATQLFTSLGFVPHPEKSVFEPTQILEFLGFLLNSITMQVTLTPKKVSKLVKQCYSVLGKKELTIRELASLIGSLVSTFPGVEFGPLHYRTLEHDKNFALKRSRGNFDAPVTLSFDSINDLDWWIKSLPTAFKTIDHKAPELILNTDASQIG